MRKKVRAASVLRIQQVKNNPTVWHMRSAVSLGHSTSASEENKGFFFPMLRELPLQLAMIIRGREILGNIEV